mgnify:CR=1 FL=1
MRIGPRDTVRLRVEEPISPLRCAHEAALFEMARPRLADDLQKVEGLLPVLGMLVRDEGVEAGDLGSLRLEHVDEAAEVGGKPHGLGGRRRSGERGSWVVLGLAEGRRPGEHEARQREPPLDRADRRRQVLGRGPANGSAADQTIEQAQVLVALPDGPNVGEDQRPPPRGFQEGLREAAGRTSRRQQD